MCNAFGIVSFAENLIWVDGLHDYRPLAAFAFYGRYRLVDFPISNMSNSGMDHVEVYVNTKPGTLVEHVGTGREYNINSKSGGIKVRFASSLVDHDLFNTDIAAYADNMEYIKRQKEDYVIIAPSNMVYTQDFDDLLKKHVASEADITLLYHKVDNADIYYRPCYTITMNKQKGVQTIERNLGTEKERAIFMDTYVMKKDLFIKLIEKGRKISSLFSLVDVVKEAIAADELDVRGISHKGFFASITDFKSYYYSNLDLLDVDVAKEVFDPKWPIYTRTNDSCPTRYFSDAVVKNSTLANGCWIEGEVENSVIGRAVKIGKGAVVKNCVLLSGVEVGEGVLCENLVADYDAKIVKVKAVSGVDENPTYIKQNDII